MPDALRVAAVVVTWNRAALLSEALDAVQAQTRAVDRLIVVDNASTDGTAALLADSPARPEVVTSGVNLGGAGGFALGIRRALAGAGCDLVWLMDDDTIPEPTALAQLVRCWAGYGAPRPAFVASRVVWADGSDHPMNTPRSWIGAGRGERAAAAAVECRPVRSASFVSVLLDADRVRECGLPIADYFLWNDDFEYTTRLTRDRPGLASSASVVVHKTPRPADTDRDPGDRFYFEVRNKIWLFTRSRGLGAIEKALYGGSTFARWSRTLAVSADRRRLLTALGRGLRDGLRPPRPTDEVLAAATPFEWTGTGIGSDAGG